MDKSKLIKRLMATFLEEMEEHVRAFNRDLLGLEKKPDAAEQAELLKNLFRTAHSLKGAARSVDVQLIEGACHRLEEILAAARDGRLQLHADLFGLLFASIDAMEEAGMRLREQQDLTEAPLAELLPRLEEAAEGKPVAPVKARKKKDVAPSTTSPRPETPREAGPGPAPQGTATLAPPERAVEPGVGTGSLRVAADKLDTLLARSGELLIARRRVESRARDVATVQDFVEQWQSEWHRLGKRREALFGRQTGDRLKRLKKELERLASAMTGDSRLLEQVAGPLDEEVRQVRMLPFAEACAGLDRLVRDLAQAASKDVELIVEGGAVELDRSILEGLKDPLRHLVRNAVDHGVETPARRREAGKPARARILVSAALRGSQVQVSIEDDGRGLDLDAVREHARRKHLNEPADPLELARLIFLPAFSTAPLITDVSGRGVGLDVVKSRVESLHGAVDLSFTPGKGACFTLTVPLTLTTLRAVLVNAGGQTYAFAGTNVQKLVRAGAVDLRRVAGREMLTLGGAPLPFAHLAETLQQKPSRRGEEHQAESRANGKMPVLIVVAGEKRMAFAVDEFVAEQEILVKSLGARISRLPLAAGATLLPSGRIALVLNAANLIRSALAQASPASPLAREKAEGRTREREAAAPVKRKRLLLVEDSVTTRTLEKSILEAAGYEVVTAVDGQAAWEHLVDHDVDLVVSDVEMPHMDGFALTEAIRGSKKLQELPVVLVTSRESEQDKARGLEAGAHAYLVKSAFDQRNLLETVAQLL